MRNTGCAPPASRSSLAQISTVTSKGTEARDPISRTHANQRTGYVFSAAWGDTNKPRQLQLGYRWFRMEKLAVNGSYAHDDAFRSGTVTNLKGHDIYANYAITRAFTLGIRAMAVERLTTREDGKRARLDLTYKFY